MASWVVKARITDRERTVMHRSNHDSDCKCQGQPGTACSSSSSSRSLVTGQTRPEQQPVRVPHPSISTLFHPSHLEMGPEPGPHEHDPKPIFGGLTVAESVGFHPNDSEVGPYPPLRVLVFVGLELTAMTPGSHSARPTVVKVLRILCHLHSEAEAGSVIACWCPYRVVLVV